MSKTLIIAEKPSVAADLARVLGRFAKSRVAFERDDYVIAWAIGHLLELAVPEDEEVKRGKWSFVNLPVIPSHFDLRPIEKTAGHLQQLVRLIKRRDVDGLINACDAGREGELIFRTIVRYAGADKPIRRLWLQSMTPAAIREAFAALRSDASMQPLAEAAVCRSESDWLVGINGTRAMTAFNSKLGGFQLTTVGRVQTPTLMIVVEREERIRQFRPRPYWEVQAVFRAAAGEYPGRWFDPAFVKAKDADADARADRLWDQARAEAIRDACRGRSGTATEESKPATQLSPLLFDLTSLQRDANSRFGMSARHTLQTAQSLYERHKVLTYPRTDARALPEDYPAHVQTVLAALGHPYQQWAQTILRQDWVRPNKRIFNNAKVSDHFAIIPTAAPPPRALADDEARIYDLVTRRFLAVFFPPAEYLVTTRVTRVEGEAFLTEGKVLVRPGWLAVYGKEAPPEESAHLAAITPGESVLAQSVELVAAETKPPARFTEATLLSAMEGAGKLVEDDDLRAAMSAKGLGTPATRAAIIEGLIYEKYLVRRGRELQPTAKAFSLAVLLRGLDIPELRSPELTGEWEFKLKQMEQRRLSRPAFMRDIAAMTRRIVEQAKKYEHDTIPGDFGVLRAPCPKCQGVIHEHYRRFQCQQCGYFLWKTLAGRQFEAQEIESLLTRGAVGPLDNFHSQKGKVFAASVRLNDQHALEFDFGTGSRESEDGTPVDFTGAESLGPCPQCGARVVEHHAAYVCEKAVGAARTCTFRCGSVILRQAIDQAQMRKLLAEKKTDLLTRFISRKGRPFRAFLVLQDGQVKFEFTKPTGAAGRRPRAGRPGVKAAPTASPAAAPQAVPPAVPPPPA